jgi:hypothetical protein
MAPDTAAGVRRRGSVGGTLVAAFFLALLFAPLPRSLNTPVLRHAFDLAHAPLFAALFLAALRCLKPRVRRPGLLAAGLSVAAAGLSELLQLLMSREASVGDLVLDLLGIAFAWAGVRSWSRARAWRGVYGLAVAACVVAAALSVGLKAVESRELAAMMPLLAGFDRPFELDRWHAKEGTWMGRVSPGHAGSGWALEVRCSGTVAYPGVSMEDFEEDWRGYRWLEWSVTVPSGRPLDLAVRLDDDQGALHGTRYTTLVRAVPPRQTYRIDLREVAAHFREHPMNMAAITELHFFLDEPPMDAVFVLDEVRLIR